jgi:raffinose/stachyose/melibiose transport system substrate-binding protein
MPARRRRGRTGRLLAGSAVGAIALLTAAACSSGGSSGGSSSSGSTGSASGTLKIITWDNPPAVNAIKAIDTAFEKKYPKVTVQLQTAADITGPYQTMLETDVDASSADIVSWYPPAQPLPLKPTRSNMTTWQFWTTNNVFEPLNGQSWLNDYTSAAQSAETYNGKTYGIVTGEYQEGVFYNEAIFARYHLTPPATYSQFLTELSTLKSHNVTPLYVGLGNVGPIYLQFLYNELMASVWYPHVPGGNLENDLATGAVKWTDPDFTTAMNEEKTIAQYLEPNYQGVPWESMPGNFAKGDSAMLLDGSWDLPAIQQANPSIKVGFFPLPGSNTPADNQAFNQDNLTFSVLKSAPNQTAANDWMAFFSSKPEYQQYVAMTGISPSQTGGTYNGFAATSMGSWFGKGVNGAVAYPILSPSDGYWDQPTYWPELQQDIISGSKTPSQVEALYQSNWKTS